MEKELIKRFYEIKSILKKDENYNNRNYKTIGGRWTVDSWNVRGIKLQQMDEGYTSKMLYENAEVIQGYNGAEYIKFNNCDYKILDEIFSVLTENS